MKISGLFRFSAIVAWAFAANLGCDGGGTTTGNGGDGGSGNSGGSDGGGGSTGGSPTGGNGGTPTTGGGGGTGGMATGGSGGSGEFAACDGKFEGQAAECQMCVQDMCKDALIACCETMGCAEIITCARENMCGGTDCYFGAGGEPGPCKDVIDAAGGPVGEAVGPAQTFGECATMQCPVCTGM
jgi:hypothetical protein